MSDTVYKWAQRELEAIDVNGKPLDMEHLSALATVAAIMANDAVTEHMTRWAGVIYAHETMNVEKKEDG